jgi:hypothetical protein
MAAPLPILVSAPNGCLTLQGSGSPRHPVNL